MSDFLLQKSCKLLKSKAIKKAKKSEFQKLKRKKNYITINKLEEQESDKNILKNLQKLHQFNKGISLEISQEALVICDDKGCHSSIKIEEPTVFTDKDFEEFEKDYCNS